MKDIPYKKWRDAHVLFLDESFDCNDAYDCLSSAGYNIERFENHFQDGDGRRRKGVQDPEVIRFCNHRGWVLVTTDGEIINAHRGEIKRAVNLGILASTHNNVGDVMEWVNALVLIKPRLEKNSFKKLRRPWFIKFDKQGHTTRHEIT